VKLKKLLRKKNQQLIRTKKLERNKEIMKKVTTIILAILVYSGGLMAQNDAISKFFSKYAEDESFTVVTISSKAFSLFADIDSDDPDQKEAMDAMSKLEGLRVLALDDSTRAPAVYKEALSLIPSKEYEELMTVRHEDQDLKFLIKDDSNGIISELLMVSGGEEGFFIISLVGEIDLNQISKLSSAMDIDGFDNLRHLDKDNKDGN
jgi:hypothetical protein